MYTLGIDPSGEFNKGKGTTGFALLDNVGDIVDLKGVAAEDYKTRMAYWAAVIDEIRFIADTIDIQVSMEDFVLYASSSKALINDGMDTSKLIGVIMFYCFSNGIPLYMRNASIVKKRWDEPILEAKGLISKRGNKWYYGSDVTTPHERDALKHALHCHHFDSKKVGKQVE